jgi:hypothetical protein
MALLNPQIVVTDTTGMPRKLYGKIGIQRIKPVWWSHRVVVLRNQPYTAAYPKPAQKAIRETFASLAHAAKGRTGFVNGLPAVAAYIQANMKTAARARP